MTSLLGWIGMPWTTRTYLLHRSLNTLSEPMAANTEKRHTVVNYVELLTSLPDTDGQGDPIRDDMFGALEQAQWHAAPALVQEAFG